MGGIVMKCTSCGCDMGNSKVCSSCGYEYPENITESANHIPESMGTSPEDGKQIVEGTATVRRAEKYLFLRKRLPLLFWLIIPQIIGFVLSNLRWLNMLPQITDSVMAKYVASIAFWGNISMIATSLAYGLILLILSKVEANYRKSGMLTLIRVLSFTGFFAPSLALIIWIVELIIAVFAMYYEYQAHSDLVFGVDKALSESWDRLWKWTIRICAALACAICLTFAPSVISLLIAGLVLVVGLIGVIITGIVRIVLLYRTSRSFR